jgi:hypothetical protein
MDVGLCCFPCVLNLYCVELHIFEVILTILMYYVLLFIIIEPGFGLSVRFWISTDLGLDLNFHSNYFFWLDLGFMFGLWVWVPSHYI